MSHNEDLNFLNAASEGDEEWLREALAYGARIDARQHDGSTALHLAIEEHRLSILPVLIELGCDLEARDDNGMTPLLYSASFDFPDGVSVLLDAGADVHARCNDGMSVVHWSVSGCSPQCLRMVVEHGADLELPAKDGRRPIALVDGDPSEEGEMLLALQALGASIDNVKIEGLGILEYARYRGWQRSVSLYERGVLRGSVSLMRGPGSEEVESIGL